MRQGLTAICLSVAVSLTVLCAAAFPSKGAASAATGPSLMKMLVRIDDMPPRYGFRVSQRPRSVTAETQSDGFDVPNLRLTGWSGGVNVGFQRKVSHLDRAVDAFTIDMMKFINPDAAHTAYEMILNRGSGMGFNVGRIGSESAGRKIVVVVGLRTVYWRYQNVVVALTGSYMTEQNNIQQLLALARAQQAKLAASLPR
jgi:hypothetical protein